ncbi:MAG: hypothetical protein ABI977_08655 [Acidobacteriota bacterium]
MRCLLLACLVFVAAIGCWEMVGAQQPASTPAVRQFKCGKIITSYDKSSDKTSVQLFPRLIYGTLNTGMGTAITSEPPRPTKRPGEPPEIREPAKGLLMQIFFTYPGKSPRVPRTVALLFTSQDSSPRYNTYRNLVAVIDGEKVDLGQADLVQTREENYSLQKILSGGEEYVKEIFGIAVSYESFVRMSQAKRLKVKLNKTDIPFNSCNIEALQNLVSQVKVQ